MATKRKRVVRSPRGTFKTSEHVWADEVAEELDFSPHYFKYVVVPSLKVAKFIDGDTQQLFIAKSDAKNIKALLKSARSGPEGMLVRPGFWKALRAKRTVTNSTEKAATPRKAAARRVTIERAPGATVATVTVVADMATIMEMVRSGVPVRVEVK